MKMLLVLCGSLIGLHATAQQNVIDALKSGKTAYIYLAPEIYKMPIGKVRPNEQIFMYNNGSGLDIYKSQPDNMPIAKPDGSFKDDMSLSNPLKINFDPAIIKMLINKSKVSTDSASQSTQPKIKDTSLPKDLLKPYKPKY